MPSLPTARFRLCRGCFCSFCGAPCAAGGKDRDVWRQCWASCCCRSLRQLCCLECGRFPGGRPFPAAEIGNSLSPQWRLRAPGGLWRRTNGTNRAGDGTSLGLSLLTHGTLGAALAEAEQFPLYRAVQTVHIVNAQHAEALVAAAVLLGSFSMLLTLGEMTVSAVRSKPKEDVRWKIAGVLVAVFLLEWAIRDAVGALSQSVRTVFWGLVPVGTLWLVFCTKTSKKA